MYGSSHLREEIIRLCAPVPIRLALGVIFMAHGSQKLFGAFGGRGVAGTIESMGRLGMEPALFWGWVLALTEFFGGLAILVGFLTRLSSVLVIITMLVAIVKVHGKGGFFAPAGFEYNLALLGMAFSLVVSGPGRFALSNVIWRDGYRKPPADDEEDQAWRHSGIGNQTNV